jgi:DNA-directed RNA polymerase subunit RPC12/RpoP
VISVKEQHKYIVNIQCNLCGERFILKGRVKKGKVETGFKKCLCDNQEEFDISKEELI